MRRSMSILRDRMLVSQFGSFICWYTYNAGDYGSLRPLVSEGLFIPNSVLDNHNSGPVLVDGWCNRLNGSILIDSLMSANDVVIRLPGFGRGFEDFFGDHGVFSVVLRINPPAL